MSVTPIPGFRGLLLPEREMRLPLVRWLVALLVPLLIFTFVWQGDSVINNVAMGLLYPKQELVTPDRAIESGIFMILFYALVTALVGYLVASDTGRRKTWHIWLDSLLFAVIPVLLVSVLNDLVLGIAVSGIVWALYFATRRWLKFLAEPHAPASNLPYTSNNELRRRAIVGSLWFSLVLTLIWLVVDLVSYLAGSLPTELLILSLVRTIVLPIAGYFLGVLGGRIAQRYTVEAFTRRNAQKDARTRHKSRLESKQVVPNDTPLRSSGARNFYMVMLVAFLLVYPAIDPFLFSYGTGGRIAGYGDAGYYVILALGLNIVVGFAGLLDLGYVAFFAIGAYTWGIVGSTQLGLIVNAVFNPTLLSWLFWPMIIISALVAAFWGIVLGAPTLRLRGDYLAIVTLGFGEIVPIVVRNLDQFTNGTNGLVGIHSPGFLGVDWSVITPIPYYYLVLALIALVIFANVRLRDSRLGRAWVALREDEIAAASSGINLRNTKLLAFGAGAFFAGIAGMYHSSKLGSVSPDAFSYGDSVVYLAMVVIGGIGSIPGVMVGALAVYSINVLILGQLDTMATNVGTIPYVLSHAITQYIPGFTFGNIRNLVFGTILITIMIFRPEGLIPSARRKRELHQNAIEEEPDVLTTLDVTPSDPAFEAEVRVE
ncbi:MAG TPA: branched-chain amino acid ABC transporter permease [Ktedonobacteraceae bacterium]